MDSSSSFDPETSLSSMAKKCLNLNTDTERKDSLSNLTAKYNSSRKNMNVFSCTANSKNPTFKERSHLNVAKKSFGDFALSPDSVDKQRYLSSSDDESDTGLSLVALAARHNSLKISSDSSQSKSSEQDMPDNSSEDECSETGFIGSLVALAVKHKGIQNTSVQSNVSSCLSEVKKDVIEIPDSKNTKVNLSASNRTSEEQPLTGTRYPGGLSCSVSEGSEKCSLEVNPKYISASFSDDSDSDEPFTLGGLALKHARTAAQLESKSVGDRSHLKPKELQRVANVHRQYSKSESDQFAVYQADTGNTINKEFRNESSTSLGSLKGSSSSVHDFEFSLGCKIPHSFKSKHMGLTSSLGSVQVPQANLSNSFSDPDVSVKERRLEKSSFQHGLRIDSFPVSPSKSILAMGGINLACAIKSPSSTNLTQDDKTDVRAEPMDEEIVTLLDNMAVDEDLDENKTNKSTSVVIRDEKDDCCLDAGYILKVKFKLQTVKCSSFGKVICKRWRPLAMPYIRPEEIKSGVIPFKFTVPSPDDVMAGFRERRIQSSLEEQPDSAENKH